MIADLYRPDRAFSFTLIMSGGNALGAFHAGAYQALHEAGLEPDWVIGTSAGAMNAAIIAGNEPDERLAKLTELWRPAAGSSARPLWEPFETARRSGAAQWTVAAGRTGVFGPLLSGAGWPAADAGKPALFETGQLAASLERLVDFDRVNSGEVRLTVTATDVENSEDVIFDSRTDVIGRDHIRASAALPVAFPPVQIDDRWLVDGGLSANLPLDPFFAAPPAGRSLCIAVDLLPKVGKRPTSIGEAASRMQDIIFAAQSRRSIERWADHYATRTAEGASSISFARLAYGDQTAEVAGKAMDFSPLSISERWRAGHAEMSQFLDRLDQDALASDRPGLRELTSR